MVWSDPGSIPIPVIDFLLAFVYLAGREEAVRTLLEFGASAGVYDDTGTSCLTHLITNMPDVAAAALEQFHRVDKASKTVFYYLSYLETFKWEESRSKSSTGARLLTR